MNIFAYTLKFEIFFEVSHHLCTFVRYFDKEVIILLEKDSFKLYCYAIAFLEFWDLDLSQF